MAIALVNKTVQNLDVNHPMIKPAGVQTEDMLLLFLAGGPLPATFTPYLTGGYWIAGGQVSSWNIGYRFAVSNEAASYSVPNGGGHAALVAHRGVSMVTPFEASQTWEQAGKPNPYYMTINTTHAGVLVWCVPCFGYWSGGVGWDAVATEYFDTWHELGTGDNIGGGYLIQAQPGATPAPGWWLNEGGGWVTTGACVFGLVPRPTGYVYVYDVQED